MESRSQFPFGVVVLKGRRILNKGGKGDFRRIYAYMFTKTRRKFSREER
ncbi:hypothetical protein SAMN04488519_101333 [Algoriphagus ornithinivorans]|uniref:Uncharacterized protein n=1 Tax=Algoriphagus ornithinivorans TaxID=226506 RepID=A0A1I5AZM2_9BACT|nr:hypothetical protein SAMN04488519_101333 [Algoriphagus ornithinivorans]